MVKLLVTVSLVISTIQAAPANNTGLDSRIIGGINAEGDLFPYIACIRKIQIRNEYHCTGSIITREFILTAAHCYEDETAESTIVYVGTHYLDRGGEAYRVAQAIMHPEFDSNLKNDIALIKVVGSIKYSANVQPIALANSDTIPGTSCTTSGWGYTDLQNEVTPNILQYLSVTVIANNKCKGQPYPVRDTNICTLDGVGKGTCTGDSGGPLLCNDALHGITSFGLPCAIGAADAYTRVTAYRQWIRDHAGV